MRTAPAPLLLLSKLVREQGYKVVLTGEGSDEVLGGYDIFKEAKVRRFWARQPDSRLRPLLLKRLYPYLPRLQSQSPAYLRAFFHADPAELGDPFFSHRPRWEMTSRMELFLSGDARQTLNGYQPIDDLEPAVREADVVVHLAWLFQPTHDPIATWRTNVLGSERVFRAVAEAKVPALVYSSSVGAYSPGPKNHAVDETWPTTGIPSKLYCGGGEVVPHSSESAFHGLAPAIAPARRLSSAFNTKTTSPAASMKTPLVAMRLSVPQPVSGM